MDLAASGASLDGRRTRTDTPLEPFLARLRAHSALSADDEDILSALSLHPAELRTHADLMWIGDRADHACFVTKGVVARFIQNRDGTRQTVSVYLPGELADLRTVILPQADSRLQALGNAAVLRIPLAELRRAIALSPAITKALWREYALEAARVAESLVNVARRQAFSRIAHLLCEMAWRDTGSEPEEEEFQFGFAITQAAIGDILGLTSVHVNRMLRALAEANVVQMDHGVVYIRQWSRLTALGEFDASYLRF